MKGPSRLPLVPTGVAGLDEILGGGFVADSFILLAGGPGAGKTVLSLQLAFECARRGEHALVLTSYSESHDRMIRNLGGFSFVDPSLLGTRLHFLSATGALEAGGLPALAQTISEEVRRTGVKLLILDSTQTLLGHAENPLAFRRYLRALVTHTGALGCTVVLIDQAGGAAEQQAYDADCVLQLSQSPRGLRRVRQIECLKNRGSSQLDGSHVFVIGPDGVVIHPRLERLLLEHPVPERLPSGRLSSGVANLDRLLGGGWPQSAASALLGPSGSGKTLIGSAFLAEGARLGEPSLLFGLYETPAVWLAKAESVGFRLADAVASGILTVQWTPPAEQLLDEMGARILRLVDAHGVKRLFLDGLDGLRASAAVPARFNACFVALMNELRWRGVATIVSAESDLRSQLSMGDEFSLPAAFEALVNLHFAPGPREARRELQILKVRDTAHDSGSHPLHIGEDGLSVDLRVPGVGVFTPAADPTAREGG